MAGKMSWLLVFVWLFAGLAIALARANPGLRPLSEEAASHVRGSIPFCNSTYWWTLCSDRNGQCKPFGAEFCFGGCDRCSSSSYTEGCLDQQPYDSLDCNTTRVTGGCGNKFMVNTPTCRWDGMLTPPCQCGGGVEDPDDPCDALYATLAGPCESGGP